VLQNKVGGQKLYKLFGHFSVLILLSVSFASAASFEDFKKSQSAAFTQYSDEKDRSFKSYLELQWQEYNAQKTFFLYDAPKPKNLPSTIAKKIKNVGPKIHLPLQKPKEKNNQKTIVVDLKQKIEKKDISFNFYGSELGFNIDKKIKSATYYPQNQKGISAFFDTVASSEYDYLVTEIQKVCNDMGLNDWGVYLLVAKISDEIFTSQDNSKLFQWFLFNKLGYAVKVGLSNRHVVVMYRSDRLIYAAPNYKFDGKKYYVLQKNRDWKIGSIYSYPKDYPGANKSIDLSLSSLPNFEKDLKSKTLSYKQFGKTYSISYTYNQNLIDFMATYPQADYETFFNAPIQESTYEELAESLKKHINGLQASTAINFVLNFVQNAFSYETDREQFGYEKVMFAQETLYYDKSDCEDRAVLFSSLVKKLFKIGVVGVKYKDHMATALYIPLDGDTVEAKGRRFVIADPTYINANLGQSMPRYKSKRPESFIVVKN
jgi:hypothetical protein